MSDNDIKNNNNDSLFNGDDDSDGENRPSYMKHLFKRHNHHTDVDPWKNNKEKTKSKNVCLSLINEVFKNMTNK